MCHVCNSGSPRKLIRQTWPRATLRTERGPYCRYVCSQQEQPHGVTVIELLIAIALVSSLAVALAALLKGSQEAFDYARSRNLIAQHGRVAVERIRRTALRAVANEQFPGFLVLSDTEGTWDFPDTLIIWAPEGEPVDPTGLPRFNELVIYCPAPAKPSRLLEVTAPNNTDIVPSPDDIAAWKVAVSQILNSPDSKKIVITDLLRTAVVPGATIQAVRGCVRFVVEHRPSQSDWQAYLDGTVAWKDLPWVQWQYGTNTGLRQSWLRFEIQLVYSKATGSSAQEVFPFFGSAAIYYPLYRANEN